MSRLDEAPSTTAVSERPLVDLPLRPEPGDSFSRPVAPAKWQGASDAAAAGLVLRAEAFAADLAAIGLLCAAAVLAASLVRGEMPSFDGWPWAAAFLVFLSFFATVPALMLFGKTVGMALVGLVPLSGKTGRRLCAGEAGWRWLGTLATAATVGTVLLWTARIAEAPTPADRLSGRTVVREDVET